MEETLRTARKPRAAAAPRPAAKKAASPRKPVARKAAGTRTPVPLAQPVAVEREQLVRMAAYFRAERRGFAAGYEWEDWLAAEAEVGRVADDRAAPKARKAPARKPRAG